MIDIKTEIYEENAVLVGVITQEQTEEQTKEYLSELAFLAETAGAQPVRKFFQRLPYPNPRTFIGQGKLEEIARYLSDNKDIGMVIFDDELSPLQLKNIENELHVKVLDRTSLILDSILPYSASSVATAATIVPSSTRDIVPCFNSPAP